MYQQYCDTNGLGSESGEKSLVRAVCSSPSVRALALGVSEKIEEKSLQPLDPHKDTYSLKSNINTSNRRHHWIHSYIKDAAILCWSDS